MAFSKKITNRKTSNHRSSWAGSEKNIKNCFCITRMSFQTQGGLHVFDIGVLFNGNSPYKLSKHRVKIYKITFCENDLCASYRSDWGIQSNYWLSVIKSIKQVFCKRNELWFEQVYFLDFAKKYRRRETRDISAFSLQSQWGLADGYKKNHSIFWVEIIGKETTRNWVP